MPDGFSCLRERHEISSHTVLIRVHIANPHGGVPVELWEPERESSRVLFDLSPTPCWIVIGCEIKLNPGRMLLTVIITVFPVRSEWRNRATAPSQLTDSVTWTC